MGPLTKCLLALLAFGALGYFCVYRDAPMIAAAVDDNVRSAVASLPAAAGVAWATDGRDVTVTGEVDSDATRDAVLAGVRSARGVRVVNDRLTLLAGAVPAEPATPPEPIEPYTTRLQRDGQNIRIEGEVPDEAARRDLGAAFANRAVVDATVLRGGADPAWAERIGVAEAAVGRLSRGTAELTDNRLRITGEVATDALRTEIETLVAGLGGVDADVDIRVVRPTVEAQQAAVADCQTQFDTALSEGRILFATGSADIDTASDALLARLATIARACPLARIDIGGHTDSTGDPAYNEYLSGQRAAAVRDNLIGRGIAADRLTATGYGAAQPVADNATRAGREQNRRIEMTVSVADE